MRALFGLVGILVAVGVIVWLMSGPASNYLETVGDAKQSAEEQTAQFAGRDVDSRRPASESAKLDLITAGGKPDSILVTSVEPDGAYARYYGLKQDDAIVEIGPMKVSENISITSAEDATNALLDAYQRKQPIVVMRDGEPVTLPQAAANQPAKPSSPSDSGDPLQQQLDAIGTRRGL